MARVVVLGGGFAGLIAAESLAQRLGPAHQITLISRQREFTFFPSLVRLAFGRCRLEEVFFDLVRPMRSRQIELIQAEVADYHPDERYLIIPRGKYEQRIPYDYLVFALGRRLVSELVPGFHEHAHHLLSVGAALKFGEALKNFHQGHAVIGYCQGARLAVPVYETAFALDRLLRARGERDRAKITIVTPEGTGELLGGSTIAPALESALAARGIERINNFPLNCVTETEVRASHGHRIGYDLLMLIPPFQGSVVARYMGITDRHDYIRVNRQLRVTGTDRIYAAGDCVDFPGPKMGQMAALQGEVAAANLAAEIEGREPKVKYDHELLLVIDEGGQDSIYLRHQPWDEDLPALHQGRFWGWAKQMHAKYWPRLHSLRQT